MSVWALVTIKCFLPTPERKPLSSSIAWQTFSKWVCVLKTSNIMLTMIYQNFGPNSTTFIIPGEVFPTRYRSTAHGISAASGKLGAIVAQVGFSRLINIGGKNKFLKHILEIFALFMLTGVFSTLLLPETKVSTEMPRFNALLTSCARTKALRTCHRKIKNILLGTPAWPSLPPGSKRLALCRMMRGFRRRRLCRRRRQGT